MSLEANVTPAVKGIPDGASVLIPRLICRDPGSAIDFYVKVFGAVDHLRRSGPDGKVVHAMLTIGPQMLMIEAEWPTLKSRAPDMDGSSSVVMYLYVVDVDQTLAHAERAGAKVLLPLTNQLWGDRTAWIMDPSGHVWTLATRIEETTEEERKRRWTKVQNEVKKG